MNETIRPHLKAWNKPPVIFHLTLADALSAWGITDESEAGQHKCPECKMIVIGRKGHKMSCDYYTRYIIETGS